MFFEVIYFLPTLNSLHFRSLKFSSLSTFLNFSLNIIYFLALQIPLTSFHLSHFSHCSRKYKISSQISNSRYVVHPDIVQPVWSTSAFTLSTILYLPPFLFDFCCGFVIRIIKQIPLICFLGHFNNSHSLHTNLHVNCYWLNSALSSYTYYSVCTYRLSGFRLESRERRHGNVLWLESVWWLSFSICIEQQMALYCTNIISKTAHDMCTLWRAEVYGTLWYLL